MKYIGSLGFLLGFVVGCTSTTEDPSRNTQRDVAAVTSSEVADVNSGPYAWKIHIQWYQDHYSDRAQIDEWVDVRAENHAQAQFKAVDYSQYVHFYRHSQGGLWCMGEATRTDLPEEDSPSNPNLSR